MFKGLVANSQHAAGFMLFCRNKRLPREKHFQFNIVTLYLCVCSVKMSIQELYRHVSNTVLLLSLTGKEKRVGGYDLMWNDGPVYREDVSLEALGSTYQIANTHLGLYSIWPFFYLFVIKCDKCS